METLTIKITDEETVNAIAETAQQQGTTPEAYAIKLISAGLASTSGTLLTFDQILAPFRRQVEESEISDEDLDGLFRKARQDYAREEEGKKN